MGYLTVVVPKSRFYTIEERIYRIILDMHLKEGALPDGMILMDEAGMYIVKRAGRGQSLEPISLTKTSKGARKLIDVLKFISSRGVVPPSIREIASKFSMSVSHARYYVVLLEENGYIARDKRKARAIRVTDKGKMLCR